jgi:hypothetical protein
MTKFKIFKEEIFILWELHSKILQKAPPIHRNDGNIIYTSNKQQRLSLNILIYYLHSCIYLSTYQLQVNKMSMSRDRNGIKPPQMRKTDKDKNSYCNKYLKSLYSGFRLFAKPICQKILQLSGAFFVMSNLSIMIFDGNLVSSLYVTVS